MISRRGLIKRVAAGLLAVALVPREWSPAPVKTSDFKPRHPLGHQSLVDFVPTLLTEGLWALRMEAMMPQLVNRDYETQKGA